MIYCIMMPRRIYELIGGPGLPDTCYCNASACASPYVCSAYNLQAISWFAWFSISFPYSFECSLGALSAHNYFGFHRSFSFIISKQINVVYYRSLQDYSTYAIVNGSQYDGPVTLCIQHMSAPVLQRKEDKAEIHTEPPRDGRDCRRDLNYFQ